jgi:hypothetical protein
LTSLSLSKSYLAFNCATRFHTAVAVLLRCAKWQRSSLNVTSRFAGTQFHRLFLDENLCYGPALHAPGQGSLEDAQQASMQAILQAAAVRDGSTVLELGSGWGALAVTGLQTPNTKCASIHTAEVVALMALASSEYTRPASHQQRLTSIHLQFITHRVLCKQSHETQVKPAHIALFAI